MQINNVTQLECAINYFVFVSLFVRYFSWHSPQAPSLNRQAATATKDRLRSVVDTDRLTDRRRSAEATHRAVGADTRQEVGADTRQEVAKTDIA